MVRYGSLTFGGGVPTAAALRHETVDRRGWLGPAQFQLAYALSRFTPGTNLLAFCAALGWQMRGVTGAGIALIASSFPCSAVTVALTIFIEASRGNRLAALAIEGGAASTIGMIAASCWQMVEPHVRAGERVRTAAIVGGAAILQVADVAPVRILLLAAVIGALWRPPR